MTDSLDVLFTLKLVYTLYSFALISLIAWFGYGLTRSEKVESRIRIPFYGYMGFLVFVGVSLHILTYNQIPWVSQDINRHRLSVERKIPVVMENHRITLPGEQLVIECGESVMFEVDSRDLTYGFGLFRKDSSMVFQIQVNPGSRNDLFWEFHKNGVYTILSTEYSGPAGNKMIKKDAVVVRGCATDDVAARL